MHSAERRDAPGGPAHRGRPVSPPAWNSKTFGPATGQMPRTSSHSRPRTIRPKSRKFPGIKRMTLICPWYGISLLPSARRPSGCPLTPRRPASATELARGHGRRARVGTPALAPGSPGTEWIPRRARAIRGGEGRREMGCISFLDNYAALRNRARHSSARCRALASYWSRLSACRAASSLGFSSRILSK